MGPDLVDSTAESRFVLTHHLAAQHLEHFRSGPLFAAQGSLDASMRQIGGINVAFPRHAT